MIADLKPYPQYKETGLPWLGQVPGHWSFERTKWRFRNRKELNASGAHTNILSLTLRGVVNNDPDNPEGMVPKDYRTYQFFAKGDLVFKLIDLENLRTSRVGLVHEDGIMSSAYVRLVPSGPTNIRYFFHQFYDLYSRGIYNQLGAGVRSTLGPSDLLNVVIVIPPPAEQAEIVRFLDHANGRLERTIRAKRKVIALLNEQKQAIIHRAVTRGLNPTVPLKPSGVSWLGDIPQHWEVRRLKFLAHIKTGGRDTADRIDGAPYPFFVRSQTVEHIDTFSFDGEAVLTAGDGAGVAKVFHYINGKFDYHQRVYKFSKFKQIDGRFFFFYLRSTLRFEALDASAKSTVDSLRLPLLQNFPTVLTTIEEQKDIVHAIEMETSVFDTAISRLEREIELLREYRTRLVADVVTGKLDVREATARLPKVEETPAVEPEFAEVEDTGEELVEDDA
jgi:type I restriction enzyme S subunit